MKVQNTMKIKIIFLMGFLLWGQLGIAQDYQSSLGGRLGTYTAVSYTKYLGESNAVEAIAGITRAANQSNYTFGGYYKLHFGVSTNIPTLSYYFGLGALINLEKEGEGRTTYLAPSALTGMEYSLEHAPVNFFLDFSTYYQKNLDSTLDLHANLGVRYILSR